MQNKPTSFGEAWVDVQKKVHDTVVQIFAKISKYNWFEPYKAPDQTINYGSGFLIHEDGSILTNFHVIEEAVGVQIQIPSLGKEQFDVEIVGIYPLMDLALLRIVPKDLLKIKKILGSIPKLALGDSDQVIRSQEILALGYPLGQQGLKSSQGIVSGREKLEMISFIQMTAPINPGSSGGPSLNSDGEVIGINFAGIEEAQNVGYIIPINEVKSAIRDLNNVRLLRRPFLGGVFSISSDDMINFLNNPPQGGYYIVTIFEDSLLARANIIEGDMIYEINGYQVDKYGEISVPWSEDKISIFDLINRCTVGETISLVIYRTGKAIDITFNLSVEIPFPIREIYPGFEPIDFEVIGGMVVMPLTLNHVLFLQEIDPLFAKYTRINYQQSPKLLITNILHNSPFQRSRAIAAGDIISEVNGVCVATMEEFRNAALLSKKTGFLTIKTEEKLFGVVSLEKIIAQEDLLAVQHNYQKSKLIDQLSN